MKAYRLNKFLHAMIDPAHRGYFLSDPEAVVQAEAGLTEEEKDLVRPRTGRA